MKKFSKKELSYQLSLYLDGALDPFEVKELEEYLAGNAEAKKEYDSLKALKSSLSSKSPIEKNEWFWARLSHTIDKRSEKKFLQRKSVFALFSAGAFAIVVVTLLLVKDGKLFTHFLNEKKEQVVAVRNQLMQGNIIPLFTNLDKEKVLQFALFGSLSIDSEKTTALQVNKNGENGYKIEFTRMEQQHRPIVSLQEFYSEIRATPNQHKVVDSILNYCKDKIQNSVFVGENEEVAIHAELASLNKEMMTNIAASLEPVQRIRFQKFLDARNAPYTVVAGNLPSTSPEKIYKRIALAPRSNRFVVIAGDSVQYTEMNPDKVRDIVENINATRTNISRVNIVIQEMIQQFNDRAISMRERTFSHSHAPIQVTGSEQCVRIQIDDEAETVPNIHEFEMVMPRRAPKALQVEHEQQRSQQFKILSDSAFAMEIPTDSAMVRIFRSMPRGEFFFEFKDSSSSRSRVRMLMKPRKNKHIENKTEWKNFNEKKIDLDEIPQHQEKRPVKRDVDSGGIEL